MPPLGPPPAGVDSRAPYPNSQQDRISPAGAGRYAPSPTSDLHLGNLRTAVVAWLFARHSGRAFHLRIEDLDQQRVSAAPAAAARQLADLAALGIDHDGPVIQQSTRTQHYAVAAARLDSYPCYCTRRDIAEASEAPHDAHRPYPGTCRDLTPEQQRQRAIERPAALRVRVPANTEETIHDRLQGSYSAPIDDFVLRRNDGTWAYNLAVVVDDLASGVDQVVRGDDLLSSAPRQAWLAGQLGGSIAEYAHIGLAVNDRGERLSKRDGAVTPESLGWGPSQLLSQLATSLNLASEGESVVLNDVLSRFDPEQLPRGPWVVPAS